MSLRIVPKGSAFRDEEDKRHREARNGVIQFHYALDLIRDWKSGDRLNSEILRELQRLAVNQVTLCAKLGMALPGPTTIPELIVQQRPSYYQALRDADAAWSSGQLDLSALEKLLGDLLAEQLLLLFEKATGARPEP